MKGASPFLAWLWSEGGRWSLFRLPFTLLSHIYGFVIRLRVACYGWGLFASKALPCRVVSIGNLSTGGTGKTPMTLYFAARWQKQGKKVGIVSRGYGRKTKDKLVLVSDGKTTLRAAEEVGDEPFLMAKRLQGIPIVVSADRFSGGMHLIEGFGVDVILMDDAFQHLKIQRDQNILLIDASRPDGLEYLLPRGPLREPLSHIQRADCVILTRVSPSVDLAPILSRLSCYQGPLLQSQFVPRRLSQLNSRGELELDGLRGKSILPVCGIGNPDSFLRQLSRLGAHLCSPLIFEDHHDYSEAEVEKLIARQQNESIDFIVTTEKDAVKMKGLVSSESKVLVLQIGLRFEPDSESELEKLFI